MAGLPARHRVLVASAGALGMLWRAYPIRPQLFSLLCFAILLKAIDTADQPPVGASAAARAAGDDALGERARRLDCRARDAGPLGGDDRDHRVVARAAGARGDPGRLTRGDPRQSLWVRDVAVSLRTPCASNGRSSRTGSRSTDCRGISGRRGSPRSGIVVFALKRGRGHRKTLVMAVVLGLMTMRVSRLDAFFAIAAMFFAARALAEAPSSSPSPAAAAPAARRGRSPGVSPPCSPPRSWWPCPASRHGAHRAGHGSRRARRRVRARATPRRPRAGLVRLGRGT